MPKNKINALIKKENVRSLESATELMRFLSNPQRLTLLCFIGENEESVGDLADKLNMSTSALSQHLSRLKNADIISSRREHNKIFYKLKSTEAKSIIRTLKKLYC